MAGEKCVPSTDPRVQGSLGSHHPFSLVLLAAPQAGGPLPQLRPPSQADSLLCSQYCVPFTLQQAGSAGLACCSVEPSVCRTPLGVSDISLLDRMWHPRLQDPRPQARCWFPSSPRPPQGTCQPLLQLVSQASGLKMTTFVDKVTLAGWATERPAPLSEEMVWRVPLGLHPGSSPCGLSEVTATETPSLPQTG